MSRYFFDLKAKDESVFDYSGEEFSSGQSAIEHAKIVGEYLTNSLSGEWIGWSLEVRNEHGKTVFSRSIELLAA
jgi:hypothetical protein